MKILFKSPAWGSSQWSSPYTTQKYNPLNFEVISVKKNGIKFFLFYIFAQVDLVLFFIVTNLGSGLNYNIAVLKEKKIISIQPTCPSSRRLLNLLAIPLPT